jgi:hypothetical protein
VLCLFSSVAHAREWVKFLDNDNERMFVDPVTEKTVGNVKGLSILTNVDSGHLIMNLIVKRRNSG